MKEVFINSKHLSLADHIFFLLDQILPDTYRLSQESTQTTDLIIIDTETVLADKLEVPNHVPLLLFTYRISSRLLQYTNSQDVSGILSLRMSSDEIRKTLSATNNGEIFYPDNVISLLFSKQENENSEKVSSITEREAEIIQLMLQDMTNEEIASKLDLSMRTVNAHKGNIMRKTGVKTTCGLVSLLANYSTRFRNSL